MYKPSTYLIIIYLKQPLTMYKSSIYVIIIYFKQT
jgi:hypothetical protein